MTTHESLMYFCSFQMVIFYILQSNMDRIESDNDTKRIVQLHRPTALPLVRIALKIEALLMNSLYLYKFILFFNCIYIQEGHTTQMDLDETTEIIDLCTPTLDNGDRSIVTQVSRDTSPFDTFPSKQKISEDCRHDQSELSITPDMTSPSCP